MANPCPGLRNVVIKDILAVKQLGTSDRIRHLDRSDLKQTFFHNLGADASFQNLDRHMDACGLKLGPALILNQILLFELAASKNRIS